MALELGRRYGVHLCLGFVRLPGYSVGGSDREPHRLFEGSEESMAAALEAACNCWRVFAERYRHVPPRELSFNLLNEPAFHTNVPRYVAIVRALTQAIRQVSPDRTIFVDGANLAQKPVLDITDLGIVQSTHDYQPKMITHYKAGWVPKEEFESFDVPTWPMRDRRGDLWDKERLRREAIDPWNPLTRRGLPVHVGEFGCNNTGPHGACLGWMKDSLSLWKEANWGWALWNLRGSFGIVDSERTDVAYEDFHGHKLDRRMLELLREG
ncbi:MAG TPA: cellulase family glycosylhydrolase [Opitutaceae bacterium]|jgi:endoglucanase|nr:cellulase family glycosylhydrolase [Opitutaceae bacterium]